MSAFKSFSNNNKEERSASPFAGPFRLFQYIHNAVNTRFQNALISGVGMNNLSKKIAGIIGYESDMTKEKVFKWLNEHPEFAGETIEAERQRRIKSGHQIFDTPIRDSVLARQPFFCGVRLDKEDPASSVVSSVTYKRIVDAYNYASSRGLSFGIASTAVFGVVLGVMYAVGVSHPGIDQITQNVVLDTFSDEAMSGIHESYIATRKIISGAITALLTAAPLLLAPAVGKIAIPAFVRRYLNETMDAVADAQDLRKPTKDSKVLYRKMLSSLTPYLDAWFKQLKDAERYKKMGLAKISYGVSTGEFRARGLLTGLEAGTAIEQNIADAFMNIVVMGGTGAGKTEGMIKPYVRQLLIHRRNGTIGKFGFYVTDAKGVLWVDIKQIAMEEGFDEKDIVVIGCGNGQYGVNTLKGIAPEMVSALIKAIMSMMSGGGKNNGNSFYDSMSATVVSHAASILNAYSRSPSGNEFTKREKRSPYCIQMIYNFLTMQEEMDRIIGELISDSNAAKKEGLTCNFIDKATIDAISYFEEQWQDMDSAKDTKANIQMTVQSQFGGLLSNPQIKARFFEGRDNILQVDDDGRILIDENGDPVYEKIYDGEGNELHFVDVDGAFNGKAICVNISSEQGGLGATFLLSFLAARFRMISTAREIGYKIFNDENRRRSESIEAEVEELKSARVLLENDDPYFDLSSISEQITINEINEAEKKHLDNDEIAKRLLKSTEFKFATQETPTFFIADEYQEMVMKGGKDFPVGDDTYWAKNRSKGVIGIIAFQFLKSIQQFMGPETTESMLGNFRNKVLLHTEDIATIEYYSKLFGKTKRFHTEGRGYYESQAAREVENGGAYADMRNFEDELREHLEIACQDAAFEPVATIKIPAQHDRLSHEEFAAVEKSFWDDYNFTEAEKARAAAAQSEAGQAASYRERDAVAMKLHEQYRSAEERAMESKFDTEEDLLNVSEACISRNFGYVYLQSYSSVLIDRIELIQDYALKAQREKELAAIKIEQLKTA